MKRPWMVLVVAFCLISAPALALGACGGGGDIVGNWSDGAGMEFRFASDGALVIDIGGQKVEATYTTEDGKLTLGGVAAAALPGDIKYKVDGDKLILTSPDAEEQTLTRK